MSRHWLISMGVALVLAAGASVQDASADDPPLTEAAKQLQRSTATLRIRCPLKESSAESAQKKEGKATGSGRREERRDERQAEDKTPSERHPCSVVVCSAVCVADRKVVTAIPVSSDARIRLTYPCGTQDDGRLRVIDEFSGLVLLESPRCMALPLKLADDLPEAGSPVMSAAAWGIEKPLVFRGMVSGTSHTLSGLCYPPLLVCQLPTTSTSTGSAVVDVQGRLVGIVVGADPTETYRTWMTYAVPVAHVRRLLRACEESEREGQTEKVVVLKRRRPVVGWKLEDDGQGIEVQRIYAGEPADKAGIKVGDRLLAVDGVKIRSVYQAWNPTMCKQPGDTLKLTIQRGDRTHEVSVVLGGGMEVESLPADKLAEIVQPKLEFIRDETGSYFARPGRASGGAEKTAADRIAGLKRTIESYEEVLTAQKEQLEKRGSDRRRQELIESLEAELALLRQQLLEVQEKSP